MARQGAAYLSGLSFVKMERPGQGSPGMTEFRRPAEALSIIQMPTLIGTSENDGRQTDSGNERRKVKWKIDSKTESADERYGISFAAPLNSSSSFSWFCPGETD